MGHVHVHQIYFKLKLLQLYVQQQSGNDKMKKQIFMMNTFSREFSSKRCLELSILTVFNIEGNTSAWPW